MHDLVTQCKRRRPERSVARRASTRDRDRMIEETAETSPVRRAVHQALTVWRRLPFTTTVVVAMLIAGLASGDTVARRGRRSLVPLRRLRPAVARGRPLVDTRHRGVHRPQTLVLPPDGGQLRAARRLGGELDGHPARGRGDRARPPLRRARDEPVPRSRGRPRLGVVGADGAAARRRVLRGRGGRRRRRNGHAATAMAAARATGAGHLRAGCGGLRGVARRPGAVPRRRRGPRARAAADPRHPAAGRQPPEQARVAADRRRGSADRRADHDAHLLPAERRPARPDPR